MRTRAFVDLDQLPDDRLFIALSEGLGLIQQNASSISEQGAVLAQQKHVTGPRILRAIAEEEAGKFLILMDAARCPRKSGALGLHLRKIIGHLAKGIYAEAVFWRMGSFGELRKWIEKECEAYYLDGPNDVDWIFRNKIIERREEAFYVDYIESEGDHLWLTPKRYEAGTMASFGLDTPAPSLELIDAMVAAGMTSPEALALIAGKWRPITMTDDFDYGQLRAVKIATLEDLDRAGLLLDKSDETIRRIMEWWKFPLHSLEIREVPVDQDKLREVQARYYPG